MEKMHANITRVMVGAVVAMSLVANAVMAQHAEGEGMKKLLK